MNNVEIIEKRLREWREAGWIKTSFIDVNAGLKRMAADLAVLLENSQRLAISNPTSAKAATHPLRHDILRHAWTEGEITPNDTAEAIGAPLGNTAYHIRMLKGYGILEQSRTKPVRGALQHFYRVTEEGEKLCADLFGPRAISA